MAHFYATVRIETNTDDPEKIKEIQNEMDYNFTYNEDGVEITDTEITEFDNPAEDEELKKFEADLRGKE